MLVIPLGLRSALESGQCVLFVGAGVGAHLFDKDGNPAPKGTALAKELAENFDIDSDDVSDLKKISQVVQLRHGRPELDSFLRKRLSDLTPDEHMQLLFKVRWRSIYTTNYDDGIQKAYSLIPEPLQQPITISTTPDVKHFDTRFEVPVYHLHGTLFGTERPYIVITEDDYSIFREQRRMLFELLKASMATSTILYVGYSHNDENWKLILEEIKAEFYPSEMPQCYRISPSTDSLDEEILKSKGIETIHCDLAEFVEILEPLLSEMDEGADQLKAAKKNLPFELQAAFELSPTAVARLTASWEYVNKTSFNATPNVREFLRGDAPNWGLISSGEYIERDIEEDIFNDLLDYATKSPKSPTSAIILGSAGYGMSTLLKTLAAKLVQEKAGPVFYLKPGRPLLLGDVEFAVSISTEIPFFVIDNAGDHKATLKDATQKLRELKKPAFFLTGERLNEWRQSTVRLNIREYSLESLSDPEIYRLIDLLKKHSELNELEHLPLEQQFKVIKLKHGKELLVAMREATEGKSFEAILEDEYRNIGNEKAQHTYLLVCCIYQHGIYVRDSLISILMDTTLPELYEQLESFTEGVIIFDCIDDVAERYAARARHRIIAKIVWKRCGYLVDRDKLLHSIISKLNIQHKHDRDAFENLIRSDEIVDEISTLDGKIRYFDSACKKDPLNPFVRQHYARMLSREGIYELALTQINDAIRMDRYARVLYHTRGLILKDLAITSESVEIGRKYLAQSEGDFRKQLSMYERDDFAYVGLAQLYIGWARKCESPEEAAEYFGKAEDIINEGLKIVRVRDALWVESSKIQRFIGDEPSYFDALERAVKEAPGSIIARYMLGRAYRRVGRLSDAIEVLEPIIENHHDEFRSFVEYALCKLNLDKDYEKAIAVLSVSSLYGLSDPRYIATLGGMLFMSGKISKANVIFSESLKGNFRGNEIESIQFYPPNLDNPSEPLKFKGRVVRVKAGHSFIESPEYPLILCPGSKYNELMMEKGLNVTFEIAFRAKGPNAINPEADITEV